MQNFSPTRQLDFIRNTLKNIGLGIKIYPKHVRITSNFITNPPKSHKF